MGNDRRPCGLWFVSFIALVGLVFDFSLMHFVTISGISLMGALFAVGLFVTVVSGSWGYAKNIVHKSTIPFFLLLFLLVSATIIRFDKPDLWIDLAHFYLASGVLFYASALIEVGDREEENEDD